MVTDRIITARVAALARQVAEMAGQREDGPFAEAVAEAVQELVEAELDEALEEVERG